MRHRPEDLDPERDVVVIGGGINGAGVARDAALRGLRVALLEKDDFGAGASSKTSKLVHGGLRYLEHGALRLVWEACHERRRLLALAPHLVRPLPFVFPVYADSRVPPWKLRLGMWLYDLLAGLGNVRPHRMLRPGDRRFGALRRERLRAAALYYDAWMDDARLVLANVLAARASGAIALNDAAVQRVVVRDGRACGVKFLDRVQGTSGHFTAPVIVSCTGAWTNHLLADQDCDARPVSPTRGAHVLVPRLGEQAFTLTAGRDGRVFFVLPWQGMTLVGTTDEPDAGDPDRTAPTETEIEYLLAEANRFFPSAHLGRHDVIAAFAGLRPLQAGGGDGSSRRREHAILEPIPGLLCVVGGKYTTYRAVAAEVVDRVEKRLGRRHACRTHVTPLPGGDVPWGAREHWEEGPAFQSAAARAAAGTGVSAETAAHLLRVHGTRAERVLALAAAAPELQPRICPHLPHIRAEVVFAIREELALHIADWMLRRSRTGYRPCHGAEALESIVELFATELDWSLETRAEEIARARRELEAAALTSLPASIRSG
jgi:glycerol-3-phosphate dehydrogenase